MDLIGMFERFTGKAIDIMNLAQEEARRINHNFVGTEQILLGLLGVGSTGALLFKLLAQDTILSAAPSSLGLIPWSIALARDYRYVLAASYCS